MNNIKRFLSNKIILLSLIIILSGAVLLAKDIVGSFNKVVETDMILSKDEVELAVNDSTSIDVTFIPANTSNQDIVWESKNPDVATVIDGKIVAKKKGETEIVVTSHGNITKTIIVKVDTIPIESISLNKSNTSINIGDTLYLKVDILPTDATDKSVTWTSSDEHVATVSNNGEVKGLTSGSTVITAKTSEGLTANCTVEVVENVISVTDIVLNQTSAVGDVGETINLIATINPSDATNKNVTWTSSNEKIATVEEGIVTLLKSGDVTIYAKSNNDKTAKCEIKVSDKKILPVGISIDTVSTTMNIGDGLNLIVAFDPVNTTDKAITWSSSDDGIAKVDENGKVIAISAGDVVITAKTVNGITATSNIKIVSNAIAITDISISKKELKLDTGDKATLFATINPSDATNKNITWSSSNERVVTVNQKGELKAVSAGSATITVKSNNGKIATCVVVVSNKVIPVNSITLNETSGSIKVKDTIQLKAIIDPDNATNKKVTWSSSDTSIITVDSNGLVTGRKAGTATVTAKTNNGKTVTCTITVIQPTNNTYTITYNANGGSGAPSKQSYTYAATGTTSLSTTKPTRTGYTFVGWSQKNNATAKEYDPGAKWNLNISKNITLYAVWQINTYTITYDANGGSGAPAKQSYTYASTGTTTLSTTKPTRTGYTFVGWARSSTATTKEYDPGVKWNLNVTKNTTLYAVWKTNTYTITYNANGGSGAPSTQSYTYATSGTIALSSTKPTRTGYTFVGWAKTNTASVKEYDPGAKWNQNITNNTTLYAIWKVNTYTITYNANGGSGAPAKQSYTYATSGTTALSATKPTKTGYTFVGWAKSSTATTKEYDPGQKWNLNNSNNTTLYAVWKVNTYTITYNANGGNGAPSTQSYTYASTGTITLSTTKPTRTGYTFVGWAQKNNSTAKEYDPGAKWNLNNAKSITLYAVWKVNTYTITYNANGGSGAPAKQSYTYATSGTTSLSATKPTRTGYTFVGWAQTSTATAKEYDPGVKWNLSNAKDTTLYAIWKSNTYTITYNANSGSGAPSTQSYTYATSGTTTLSTTKPTRTGYTFVGWAQTSTATAKEYDPGAKWNLNNAKNVTLYAIWKANTYSITYNANGGSGAPAKQSYTYATSGTVALSSTKPTRTGYTFVGWAQTAAATTKEYDPGAKINKNIAKDLTLYAIWKANTYTITYNVNGGSGTPAKQSYTYATSGTTTLSTTIPTRTGYTFVGWAKSNTASTKEYDPGQKWNLNNSNNTTLYAVWKVNTYTITYNANGGSGAPAKQSYTYATSGTVALSSTKPTRTGHSFVGWAQTSTATAKEYDPGAKINKNIAKNLSLYAIWKANTYTITYNANSGSGAPSSVTYTYADSGTTTLSTTIPTKTGYTFVGWAKSSTATAKEYDAGGKINKNIANNTTLYAVWKANTYSITYNANGGSGAPAKQNYTYAASGTTTLSTTKPTRTGYTFVGWAKTKNATAKEYDPGAKWNLNVTKNTTLYAVWKANTYTLTYNANSGSGAPSSKSYTYADNGSLTLSSTIPTKNGYTFVGWAKTNTATAKEYDPGAKWNLIAKNTTLYAVWKVKTYTLTYNANGGTVNPTSKKVNYGSTCGDLPTPTRIGYIFNGWYTLASGGNKVTSSTEIKSNKTIYAQWTRYDPESISLDCTTLNLDGGSTHTITAKLSPTNINNKTVYWASSNPRVAKVDNNGKITANSKGTSIITATTTNGLSTSCVVNVTLNDIIYNTVRYKTSSNSGTTIWYAVIPSKYKMHYAYAYGTVGWFDTATNMSRYVDATIAVNAQLLGFPYVNGQQVGGGANVAGYDFTVQQNPNYRMYDVNYAPWDAFIINATTDFSQGISFKDFNIGFDFEGNCIKNNDSKFRIPIDYHEFWLAIYNQLVINGQSKAKYSGVNKDTAYYNKYCSCVIDYQDRRMPRTWIAYDSYGNQYVAVASGRDYPLADGSKIGQAGLTYSEIIDVTKTFMTKDIVSLFNLDGGGSSSFIYNGNKQNGNGDKNNDTGEYYERTITGIFYW